MTGEIESNLLTAKLSIDAAIDAGNQLEVDLANVVTALRDEQNAHDVTRLELIAARAALADCQAASVTPDPAPVVEPAPNPVPATPIVVPTGSWFPDRIANMPSHPTLDYVRSNAGVRQPQAPASAITIGGDCSGLTLRDDTSYVSDGTAYFPDGLGTRLIGKQNVGLYGPINVFCPVKGRPMAYNFTEIGNAQGHVLDGLRFLPDPADHAAYGHGTHLRIRSGQNMTVRNCTFQGGGEKVIVLNDGAQFITIEHNEIFDHKGDVLQIDGADDVNYLHNYSHGRRAPTGWNYHADIVQTMVLSQLAPKVIYRLVVRGNLCDTGEGSAGQIFFNRNEKGITPYSHVGCRHEQNVMIGAYPHVMTMPATTSPDYICRDNLLVKDADVTDPWNAWKFASMGGYGSQTFMPKIKVPFGNSGNEVYDSIDISNRVYAD